MIKNTQIKQLAFASAALLLATQTSTALNYTAGHADIGVGWEDEGSGFELHPHWHTHTGAVVGGVPEGSDGEYEGDALTAIVPASREFVAGSDATFNTGAGTTTGSSYWMLPSGNVSGVPFLGIGTEELDPSFWDGDISITLGSVVSPSGSGNFSLYQFDGSFNFYWSTADVGSNPGVTMAPGTHDHFAWVFTEVGEWTIDITFSGDRYDTGTSGPTTFQTATESFSFTVVPEPSSYAALAGVLALGLVAIRRRRS